VRGPAPCLHRHAAGVGFHSRSLARTGQDGRCLQRYPEWRWLAQTCTNEVVIGQDGTSLRLDLAVPPELSDERSATQAAR
jgi:hypothetical protein